MLNEALPDASEIKALFDRIAPVYDQMNNWLSLGQHRIWKQMTVKWSEPRPGDRGLDVCCGSGDLSQLLARQVGKKGQVIGVDFSPQLLAIARQRAALTSPHLRLEFVEGDALKLPFENNTFHCATMGYGLRNVTDIPLCLRELHRVLSSGAKVAILDFHQPQGQLMQTFQQWYLKTIVVSTAERLGLTAEYAYITPSLERFPTGQQQVKLGLKAGFSHAIHYPIAGGMMGVLVLTK
ncbi:bifunctional demethylmenaquinone methyltransferase/2-methoxy-6-polyprenyl-1,4-benzoquinol methylase UbiE [Gloeothece verrucosa]|uniref:2-phytyl-1,4-naphtoquinone methyltransferase n=1 Tax=Gloeothece verrucosa (strain PCC 7822) TaxID=497965 RepID=E0U743_GLOV7|nr:bifunctional demethylmenaquinone methyltransferase/2-methoxy-6-polyprenyl-1,4-benzoquinol methylase UbiE [Gloeothece verrucosa]ADN17199.1 ubiquinone/menaquinone biosynthesis methyltransferase [Gloeothece verrucosa PCC 7822]